MEGKCVADIVFAHPILQALFTFLQMHFLFVNSEVRSAAAMVTRTTPTALRLCAGAGGKVRRAGPLRLHAPDGDQRVAVGAHGGVGVGQRVAALPAPIAAAAAAPLVRRRRFGAFAAAQLAGRRRLSARLRFRLRLL